MSAASELLCNFNIWSMTYLYFSPFSFENGRIDHFTGLLNDLLNRYNTYWQLEYMC